ncbi:uncharacterized protein LOC143576289, partial [Bidens hawaiensis]|uniref:uncharacterized protein LOC143576289 n=1 Tax=Bidens hawaiensis TaxID=980011 RepID=UPI00404B90F3
MNSIGLNMNDIDVACEVSLSPKEVDKFDKEMHSEKSHLNEDRASSLNMQTKEDDLVHNDKESVADVYIPELDGIAKSPQNETNARITSIYASLDMSLARIQRSKSRQKARELRTGGKSTAKSYVCNETKTSHSLPEKSNGSYEIPSLQNEHKELDVGIMAEPTGDALQQSCEIPNEDEGEDNNGNEGFRAADDEVDRWVRRNRAVEPENEVDEPEAEGDNQYEEEVEEPVIRRWADPLTDTEGIETGLIGRNGPKVFV